MAWSTSKSGDAGLYWPTLNCDAPRDQSVTEAAVCDSALFSEPVMQAVVGVFTRIDTPLKAAGGEEEAQGKTICVPESQPVIREALGAIPWLEGAKVKTLRLRTLIDCIAALDRGKRTRLSPSSPKAGSSLRS